jgi:PAS domain S-box-containing protein
LAIRKPSTILRFGVALFVTLLVYQFGEQVLAPMMAGHSPQLVLLLAVALSGAYGGFGPGLLSAALAAIMSFPAHLSIFSPPMVLFPELIRSGLLFAVGVIVSALFGALHLARNKEERVSHHLDRELHSRRAVERALNASNQRFEKISAAVPDILFMASASGGLEYMNARWEEYTGLPCDISLGAGWRAAIHPDDLLRADANMAAAIRAGDHYEFRLRLRGCDGLYRTFLLRALPAYQTEVDGVRWFGAMTDVDAAEQARAALRSSEERLQLALDAAEMGTFSFDFDTLQPDASARAWSILGFDAAPSAVADVEWLKTLVEQNDWEPLYHAFVSACDPSGPRRFRQEVRVRTRSQRRHVMVAAAITFVPDTEGAERPVRCAGTLLDVTETRAAAAQVEDAQAGLRLALDATRLGTWDYDVATREFRLYPRALQIYGLEQNSTDLADGLLSRIDPADRELVERVVQEALEPKGSGRFEVEHRIRRPDGRVRWVAVTGQVRFERIRGVRTPIRMSGTALDITERRRALDALSESEERFRLAADAIDGIIYDCDVQTGVVQRSNGLHTVLGWRPDQVPATMAWWREQIHPDDRAQAEARYEAAITVHGSLVSSEYRARHHDGSYRHLADRATLIYAPDGAPARLVGCTQDVTVQRATEAALRASDEIKNRFLALLAHELRGPLAPMRNAVALLQGIDVSKAVAQHSLKILDRQLAHTARLIDDLLDVSRIAGSMLELKREPVSVPDLIERAVETVQPIIDERKHELRIDIKGGEQKAWLDPVRITQVVSNLLTNAAKYTPPGGRIDLVADISDVRILIRVQDNGIGIPRDGLERIFAMFSQLERPETTVSGGLGIGLALSRTLVGLHGGRLLASSDGPGTGARFEIELPFVPSVSFESPAPAAVTPLAEQRIVVADDNIDSAESLAALLKLAGHNVFVAHDGAAAVRLTRSMRPTIVVLDLGMPIVDGFEAARQIRAESGGADPVLIALSGFGQTGDRERSKQAGFDLHLIKPVDPGALDLLLAQAMAGRRASNPESAVHPSV